jgi:hypothetical protein
MTSIDLPQCETIGERNAASVFGVVDQDSGVMFGRGYEPRDWQRDPLYGFASPLPLRILSAAERRAIVEAREAAGTTMRQLRKKFSIAPLHQGSTNFCWANAPVQALHYLQVITRGDHERLSPASVAAPLTRFQNIGGWCTRALKRIAESGVNTVAEWPANAIDRRYQTQENAERAKQRRVTEWYELEPRNWDQYATCLAVGLTVAIGLPWWRHAVLAVDLAYEDGKEIVVIDNSWGAGWGDGGLGKLSKSRALPDEAVALRVHSIWSTP